MFNILGIVKNNNIIRWFLIAKTMSLIYASESDEFETGRNTVGLTILISKMF